MPEDPEIVLEEHCYSFDGAKKQYILNWLMDTMGNFKQHQSQESELCTCNTDGIKSMKSSQLEFWGMERREKKPKTFLDALKNIFKKKKDGEDEEESSEEESETVESEGENEIEEKRKEEETKALFRTQEKISMDKGPSEKSTRPEDKTHLPVDSFENKIKMVKKHLKMSQAPPLAPSEPTCKGSLDAFSAYTKELTGVPYLKKTERVEWQDKNRENRFRLSSLVYRYRTPDGSLGSKPCPPKCPTQIKPKRTLREKGREQSIEAIFAKEHMSKRFNCNMKQVYNPPITPRPKVPPLGQTQAWHDTVNRVRESMRTLDRNRTPSKVSVDVTLTEDDEIFTPFTLSHAHSRFPFTRQPHLH